MFDCVFYFMWIPCNMLHEQYPEAHKISFSDMRKLFKDDLNYYIVKSLCIN